jgi:hypothetical protein
MEILAAIAIGAVVVWFLYRRMNTDDDVQPLNRATPTLPPLPEPAPAPVIEEPKPVPVTPDVLAETVAAPAPQRKPRAPRKPAVAKPVEQQKKTAAKKPAAKPAAAKPPAKPAAKPAAKSRKPRA